MVAQNFDVLSFVGTETISSRRTEKGQVACRIEVGIRGKATVDTAKPVPYSVSSVPSTAKGAEGGSISGAFPFQPNPVFLTPPLQQLYRIGIKPMRQPPVEFARELPSLAFLHIFKVLNTEKLHIGKVNLFQCMTNKRFDLIIGMLLPSKETLNSFINLPTYSLAIRKDKAILVIGIHSNDLAFCPQWRFRFLKDEIDKDSIFVPPQAYSLRYSPPVVQEFIDNFGGTHRYDHLRSSRANKLNGKIKRPVKWLDGEKMVVKSNGMSVELGLSLTVAMGRPNYLLSLLGQALCQTSSNSELISTTYAGNSYEAYRNKT